MYTKVSATEGPAGYLNMITGNGICKPCLERNVRKGEFSEDFIAENLMELTQKEAQKFTCIFCGRNLRIALQSEGGSNGS